MIFEERFPLRFLINLDRRPDRLEETLGEFAREGITAERFPATDAARVRNFRRQGSPGQYACQLSHRILLRRARAARVPAVLIFEDDVGLAPAFREKVERMSPPEDWGILVFGCTHVNRPEVVSREWVRVRHFWGTQAYAVKRRWLKFLLRELRKPAPPGAEQGGVDNAIARLSRTIPIYAPHPGWAIQREGYSDLMRKDRRTFGDDFVQLRRREAVRGLTRTMKRMKR